MRYLVKEVERSLVFYTKHLGFKVEWQFAEAPFASVSNGSMTLWLSGPESSGARPLTEGRKQEPGGWNRFVLQVDDLASTVAELQKARIRFRNEIVEGPGGKGREAFLCSPRPSRFPIAHGSSHRVFVVAARSSSPGWLARRTSCP